MEENVVTNICGGLKWDFKIIFFHKIVRVLKILIQNLTRFESFVLKSDTFRKFCFEILRVLKFLIENLTRCRFFC